MTCPVTDFATQSSAEGTRFVSHRFTDFPTLCEAFRAGHLNAGFILAPLAMALREQGVPIRIAYLGHRDGSQIVVARDSSAQSLRDLRGKTFAIPSRFSNQFLVLTKLLEDQGLGARDLKIVELPPPEMPGALAGRSIDAYFVGEPFCGKAEFDGTGRVLSYVKDVWPNFISCVLVVSEKLIREQPDVVKDLVRGIASSGAWAEGHREEAAALVAPYYRQDEKLLRFVLTNPPDRVRYANLIPGQAEMSEIMRYALKAGTLKNPVDLDALIDTSFVPDLKPAQR